MKYPTYENLEITKVEASLFMSPHDIKSIVRINQNDTSRIKLKQNIMLHINTSLQNITRK